MKLSILKTTTVLLSSAAIMGLSGCGTTGTPTDKGATGGELKDMTTVQAKDAMALNAMLYPIIVPAQSCLGDIKQCISDLYNPSVQTTTAVVDLMTPGPHNCTPGNDAKGQYFVDSNDGTNLTVRFGTDSTNPGCKDTQNAQDIEGALMATCIKTILDISIVTPTSSGAGGTGTYEVEYEGKVTCIKDTSAVLENYNVSAFGQGAENNPNRHSYNMTVSMTNGLNIDGTYQAEKWAPLGTVTDPKINDETWTFRQFNVGAASSSTGTTIVADGGASYVGTVREGDTANNGMTLAIDFAKYAYTIAGSLADSNVAVSGGISASCHPEVVTYGTTATMNDLNNVRDAAANRMPSSGSMSVAIPGYNPAPAEFTAPGTSQVTITASEGPVVYDSWKAISTTSSCAGLQTIIDRVIPANKPINSIEISEGCSLTEGALINAGNPLILEPLQTKCINAFATYADGSRERVTTTVFWTSSDRSVVTMPLLQTSSEVTSRFLFSPASTTVNATLYGVTSSAPVEVTPALVE